MKNISANEIVIVAAGACYCCKSDPGVNPVNIGKQLNCAGECAKMGNHWWHYSDYGIPKGWNHV